MENEELQKQFQEKIKMLSQQTDIVLKMDDEGSAARSKVEDEDSPFISSKKAPLGSQKRITYNAQTGNFSHSSFNKKLY